MKIKNGQGAPWGGEGATRRSEHEVSARGGERNHC